MNIRDSIVARRKERIEREGHSLGAEVPRERSVPLVPFLQGPPVICEIKRSSPSKGEIAAGLNAVDQAELYSSQGIRTVSVLTEEEHFSGSLRDLMEVKKRFPRLSVLRKDFLIDSEDLDVSYRAGADAVLLIASLFTPDGFSRMYRYARKLGLECLVEIHSQEDAEIVRNEKPEITGINSRDLTSFRIDPLIPLKIRNCIDWPSRVVFESGIFFAEQARFVRESGFAGILVGEAVVRNRTLAGELVQVFSEQDSAPEAADISVAESRRNSFFWARLCDRQFRNALPGNESKPLLKVCGITRPEDGEAAVTMGADIIGFIFADSPRKAAVETVRSLGDLDVLKAGIVVMKPGETALPDEVVALMSDGVLDVIQFHGDEAPDVCSRMAFPYYKALRVRNTEVLKSAAEYRCPRVLLDAYSPDAHGGTGKRIEAGLLECGISGPLWLAGGLNPGNIRDAVEDYSPELVDVSSGLEISPGIKDRDTMKRFFMELNR